MIPYFRSPTLVSQVARPYHFDIDENGQGSDYVGLPKPSLNTWLFSDFGLRLFLTLPTALTLFDMGFFEPSILGGMTAPSHNFVVIVPMIMKYSTNMKLDVFYTVVAQKFVASLLLRNYDVMTYF